MIDKITFKGPSQIENEYVDSNRNLKKYFPPASVKKVINITFKDLSESIVIKERAQSQTNEGNNKHEILEPEKIMLHLGLGRFDTPEDVQANFQSKT